MAFGNLRRAGKAQLTFGILSLLTGIAMIVLFFVAVQGQSNAATSFIYIAYFASPIYCCIWAIVAGAVGSCASEERMDSMTCIKVCVIVFSILATLAAAVQTGLCAFVGWIQLGYFNTDNASLMAIAALSWVGCLLGLLTFFTAIVHASVGCCCPGDVERKEAYQMH